MKSTAFTPYLSELSANSKHFECIPQNVLTNLNNLVREYDI